MGELKNFISALHNQTRRDYLKRMNDDKVNSMLVAKKYDYEYWDGDRKFGYGGYFYDGRWKVVAEKLIFDYKLNNTSKILDVGCGKGFLLYEIKKLLPSSTIIGFDISKYGISKAPEDLKNSIFLHSAQDEYPYSDNYFDLVISLGTLHNLRLFDLIKALKEIERVGKSKYVMVESYRNESEMFNLVCWALTAESIFDKDEWIWLFLEYEYCGDYEFIYFQNAI